MMKRVVLAAAWLAVIALPSQAETRFRGTVFFTATKDCNNGEAKVGWNFHSEYHARIPGNFDFSALSLVHDYGAIGYKLSGADFGPSFKRVANGGVGWGDPYKPQTSSFVLISSQSPAVLDATTPSVTIAGKIRNVWGETGSELCVVTFRGVYVRLVN